MKKSLPSFAAKVNDAFHWEGLQPGELDLVPLGNNRYHLIYQSENYVAQLLEVDYQRKAFAIRIDGSRFDIQLNDEYDQLVKRLGLHAQAGLQVSEIKAPMPGLVLDVSVSEGDEVEEGQTLLILEAMKMENVIKAPAPAKVKAVDVRKGEAVDKGFVLIDME